MEDAGGWQLWRPVRGADFEGGRRGGVEVEARGLGTEGRGCSQDEQVPTLCGGRQQEVHDSCIQWCPLAPGWCSFRTWRRSGGQL